MEEVISLLERFVLNFEDELNEEQLNYIKSILETAKGQMMKHKLTEKQEIRMNNLQQLQHIDNAITGIYAKDVDWTKVDLEIITIYGKIIYKAGSLVTLEAKERNN